MIQYSQILYKILKEDTLSHFKISLRVEFFSLLQFSRPLEPELPLLFPVSDAGESPVDGLPDVAVWRFREFGDYALCGVVGNKTEQEKRRGRGGLV